MGRHSPYFAMSIKVAAIFEKGKMKPAWFVLDNRRYQVQEINYEWQTKKGLSKVYHFAVSDGTNSFEISFDDKEMTWEIKESHCERSEAIP
jgi:hypothetical protein